MRDNYLDLKDPQEGHEGKYFVNAYINYGAPYNYLITFQFTEGDQHIIHDPIHGPG